jgi:DNA-binding winged helix-turn-helix (wHTH) protein
MYIGRQMVENQRDRKVQFDAFEFDLSTGELQKNGQPVPLQSQPARLLGLLTSHPGDLVTRADIQKALWPDGRFVEYEHAINTAIKKVREALDDDPENPRFIQTLPKLGYRFLVAVTEPGAPLSVNDLTTPKQPVEESTAALGDDEFSIPHARLSRFLFLLIQAGYLAMYCAALYYMPALEGALLEAGLAPVNLTLPAVLVLAMCGIAVRLYLLSAVGWSHPAAFTNFLRLFPAVFLLDALWAACPLLAIRVLGPGIALAGVAAMAYLPFAQRTLIRSVYSKNVITSE